MNIGMLDVISDLLSCSHFLKVFFLAGLIG